MSKHLCMLFAIMIQWNGTRLFASKTGRTFLVNMVLPKVRGERGKKTKRFTCYVQLRTASVCHCPAGEIHCQP